MINRLEFEYKHIEDSPFNAVGKNEDWEARLNTSGIEKTFQTRLLDPAFIAIRFSRSAKEWVLIILELRYQFLASLNRVIINL